MGAAPWVVLRRSAGGKEGGRVSFDGCVMLFNPERSVGEGRNTPGDLSDRMAVLLAYL